MRACVVPRAFVGDALGCNASGELHVCALIAPVKGQVCVIRICLKFAVRMNYRKAFDRFSV